MAERIQPRPERASGGRFFENLAYLVPGYHGYKDKALRREEDSRLRGRALAGLRVLCTLLEERHARLVEQSLDGAAQEYERRLHRLESLAQAIRYAPYGFSGFFEVDRVREETLERLLETDLLLFQDLDEATERLRGAPFPPRTRSALAAFLEQLDADIERIETRLVLRDKVLGDD